MVSGRPPQPIDGQTDNEQGAIYKLFARIVWRAGALIGVQASRIVGHLPGDSRLDLQAIQTVLSVPNRKVLQFRVR